MKKLIILFAFLFFYAPSFAQFKLNKEDRLYWNGFVDFIKAKGFQGRAVLNRRDLDISRKLFQQYNKLNGRTVDYTSFILMVQSDLLTYRRMAVKQIEQNEMLHSVDKNCPLLYRGNIKKFMSNLSAVDGFAGTLTTAKKFPNEVVTGYSHVRYNDIYYADRQEE